MYNYTRKPVFDIEPEPDGRPDAITYNTSHQIVDPSLWPVDVPVPVGRSVGSGIAARVKEMQKPAIVEPLVLWALAVQGEYPDGVFAPDPLKRDANGEPLGLFRLEPSNRLERAAAARRDSARVVIVGYTSDPGMCAELLFVSPGEQTIGGSDLAPKCRAVTSGIIAVTVGGPLAGVQAGKSAQQLCADLDRLIPAAQRAFEMKCHYGTWGGKVAPAEFVARIVANGIDALYPGLGPVMVAEADPTAAWAYAGTADERPNQVEMPHYCAGFYSKL